MPEILNKSAKPDREPSTCPEAGGAPGGGVPGGARHEPFGQTSITSRGRPVKESTCRPNYPGELLRATCKEPSQGSRQNNRVVPFGKDIRRFWSMEWRVEEMIRSVKTFCAMFSKHNDHRIAWCQWKNYLWSLNTKHYSPTRHPTGSTGTPSADVRINRGDSGGGAPTGVARIKVLHPVRQASGWSSSYSSHSATGYRPRVGGYGFPHPAGQALGIATGWPNRDASPKNHQREDVKIMDPGSKGSLESYVHETVVCLHFVGFFSGFRWRVGFLAFPIELAYFR